MAKILILGGAGFIGNALLKRAVDEGHSVRVFDRNEQHDLTDGTQSEIDWVQGSLEDAVGLKDALKGIDVVFHLISSEKPKEFSENPAADLSAAVFPSISLLNAMRDADVRRIVYASSGGTVYGPQPNFPITESHVTNPVVPYGLNKLVIEKLLLLYSHHFNICPIILRLSNAYGPGQKVKGGQGVLAALIRASVEQRPLEIWGDGSVVRDYVYVDDIARSLMMAIDYKGSDNVFNISSSVGKSINDLVRIVEGVSGSVIACKYHEARQIDVKFNVLDNKLALRELRWSPRVKLEQGIEFAYREYCLRPGGSS